MPPPRACPHQLANNRCILPNCSYTHDLTLYCRVCNIFTPSSNHLDAHRATTRHTALSQSTTRCLCAHCGRAFTSEQHRATHMSTSQCRQQATQTTPQPPTQPPAARTEVNPNRPSAATTARAAPPPTAPVPAARPPAARPPVVPPPAVPSPAVPPPTTPTPMSAVPPPSVETGMVMCTPCNHLFLTQKIYLVHKASPRHNHRVSIEHDAAEAGLPIPAKPTANYQLCVTCNFHILLTSWGAHLAQVRHQEAARRAALRAAVRNTERDQAGLVVSHAGETGVDFGIVEVNSVQGIGQAITVTATVTGGPPGFLFRKAKVVSTRLPGFTITRQWKNTSITNPAQYLVTVVFSHRGIRGRFEDRLVLGFRDLAKNENITVTRPLRAILGSQADQEMLQPIEPYSGHRVREGYDPAELLFGEEPEPLRAIPWKGKLKPYFIPDALSEILDERCSPSMKVTSIHAEFLPEPLSAATHVNHWHTLLHVEEHQMREDVERFNMKNVPLNKRGRYYFLRVPGLAEKRPSVLVGDPIVVISPQGKPYGGFVHVIDNLEVGLDFHHSFPERKQLYSVEFSLCRIPLQRMHQALDQPAPSNRLLFPTAANILPMQAAPSQLAAQLKNRKIANNPPQLQAVTSILSQPPGSVPFIVFGPPGTGKTVTIVEAILQVLARNPAARVLACAPSNSAADILAQRLIEFGKFDKTKLFRLIAPSRMRKHVPEDLIPFTCIDTTKGNGNGVFSVPSVAHVTNFRVVISTCVTACVLSGIRVPRGNYSHIFVDEAGQAMEPEVLVAIKTMVDKRTNLVLSGDPRQLGPVIQSRVSRMLRLDRSYLDRLMAMPMYDSREGHGTTTVKLIQNYRSHANILKFPNDKFYDGELQAHGNPETINRCLHWDELRGPRNRRFPLIFHGIAGKDLREGRSPSYFNIEEASLVKRYVKSLKRFGLADSDIGVISPYSAQCGKIRMLLSAPEITVGSAEQFQGQERTVIILSTVRSNQDEIEFDLRHTLGFVANRRRFNVAVTRAKALLIVVGDPYVLSLDTVWREFMDYIRTGGGWRGLELAVPPVDNGGDDDDNDIGDSDVRDLAYAQSRRSEAERRLGQLIERCAAGVDDGIDEGDEEDGGAADAPIRDRND
ncbi:hypothetical protein BOTBODRAFT_39425 [Botryobasidium botryosum FD-172 SS1]|uniref:RNA helicase n=1 Tax=Botryobasidium botryosum (strain FD-172 SS1) TaxID=930990 RepID=A0A067M4B3_BOTB1|nr:hypothetical protein BOTBODRAFT_39425 [Botryobasidium botryosum FD-172 SS1]